MAVFTPNKPIVTDVPSITVDAGLAVGTHRFTLVVVDAQGNQSDAYSLDVTIYRPVINPVPIPIPIPIPVPIPAPTGVTIPGQTTPGGPK